MNYDTVGAAGLQNMAMAQKQYIGVEAQATPQVSRSDLLLNEIGYKLDALMQLGGRIDNAVNRLTGPEPRADGGKNAGGPQTVPASLESKLSTINDALASICSKASDTTERLERFI